MPTSCELWDSHTTEYYLAEKRNKRLIHMTQWLSKRISLSLRSQTPTCTCRVISIIKILQDKNYSVREQIKYYQWLGGEGRGWRLRGMRGLRGMECSTSQLWWRLQDQTHCQNLLNYTLKVDEFVFCKLHLSKSGKKYTKKHHRPIC